MTTITIIPINNHVKDQREITKEIGDSTYIIAHICKQESKICYYKLFRHVMR